MSREEPYFRKCCFCVPLKSCLQTWSVIKSMADISIAVFIILVIIIITRPAVHESDVSFNFGHFSIKHALLLLVIALVIDSVFMVVLSVGLFTNNLRSLRIFYYYSIYMVVMGVFFVVAVFFFWLFKLKITNKQDHLLLAMFAVCGFINTALDICIILTLKSEMIKIRNKQQYEFFKMPSLNNDEVEPAEPFQADEEYPD